MEQVWSALEILRIAIIVVLMFGASIFVHEFGHYWVARRRGMKVEAFAIGFGPKIVGWTRDGIEYSWRWIPAGGFVKLPQMQTSDAIEGGNAEAEKIPPAAPWSKILVAVAGPLMNIVFAFVIATLIYFVGLPVPVNPPILGAVREDSEEGKMGIRSGDRITAVNGKPVNTWHDVIINAALARTNVIPVLIERAGVGRTYMLTAKTDEDLGLKMFNLESQDHQIIREVNASSPAEKAGLQPRDRFVSFAGIKIVGREQLIEIINKRAGVACEVEVERAGGVCKLTVTPQAEGGSKIGRIGIVFAITPMRYQLMKPGPAPWDQIEDVLQKTFDTLGALFYSKQTGVGAKDLSGPVGILAMLAAQVNTDFRLALSFLVLLNVNLAILNLLPIPVLDGGHIVMSIIEKIRRRPLSVKFVEYTTTAFAVMLISFMLYVSFHDIKRAPLLRSLFQRESTIEPVGKSTPKQGATPALTPAKSTP
jgi:regulator of sigma E protease